MRNKNIEYLLNLSFLNSEIRMNKQKVPRVVLYIVYLCRNPNLFFKLNFAQFCVSSLCNAEFATGNAGCATRLDYTHTYKHKFIAFSDWGA